MSKCGNCCYGVMTGPNRMFCSVQKCSSEDVFYCEDYEPIVKPQTKADDIRSMSDEELAEFMNHGACPPGENVSELCCDEDGGSVPDMCNLCWLNWLREEAK